MNKELKISAEFALEAYNNTDANGRELLEHLFGEDIFKPKDIRDRIKTFDDAFHELGDKHELVKDYKNLIVCDCFPKDIIAYAKLRIIADALNEGWKPKFDCDECHYYPWFYIYTKEEYEELDEDEKKECRIVGRSNNKANTYGGIVDAIASHASSDSYSYYGSRLAFKTRELAKYCGKQFIDIWSDFLFA